MMRCALLHRDELQNIVKLAAHQSRTGRPYWRAHKSPAQLPAFECPERTCHSSMRR